MRLLELLVDKSKNVFQLAFGLLCICVFARVYVSCTVAVKGVELNELHAKKLELEEEVALLRYEDINLSSLAYVEKRASDLGFVKSPGAFLVVKPAAVAAATSIVNN